MATQADDIYISAENVFDFCLLFSSAGETHLRILQTLKTWQFHNVSHRKSKDPLSILMIYLITAMLMLLEFWEVSPLFIVGRVGTYPFQYTELFMK